MSDAESKGPPKVEATSDPTAEAPAFVEDDAAETRLPYDKGGVPIYIALAWAGIIITYIAVMATLALPDFRRWTAH